MSQLTESEIIQAVNKKIKGAKAKLGGDTEIRRIINEAQGDLRLDIDLISAKKSSVPFVVYGDIFEYACPVDIDYDKGISIIPQQESLKNYKWSRYPLKYFYRPQNPIGNNLGTRDWYLNSAVSDGYDSNKNGFAFNFEDNNVYLMLMNNLSGMSSTSIVQTSDVAPTNGGTWVASSDATNVYKDTQNFVKGSSSVAFDSLGSTTTPILTNSTFPSVNLSSYEDKGVIHLKIYLPSTVPTSITLNWGSSSGNYWTKSVTTRKNGLPFKNGWNLLEFDWASVDPDTGTPDSSAVNFFQVVVTNSAATALKGYRIDDIYARLGKVVNMEYYSKYLVEATDGTRKENFTTASDVTILEKQEVNQLIEKSFQKASLELRELRDHDIAKQEYTEREQKLKDRFPSEIELEGTTYYNI